MDNMESPTVEGAVGVMRQAANTRTSGEEEEASRCDVLRLVRMQTDIRPHCACAKKKIGVSNRD